LSATMDWPKLGSMANVRTTGAQNMISAEVGSKFRDSWTDEMLSSAGAHYIRTRTRLVRTGITPHSARDRQFY
jgi:hypothetical protein